MHESRMIELDLLANRLIEKYYLSKFDKQLILELSTNFKLNSFDIDYFLDRVKRNIELRNRDKILNKSKTMISNLEQTRLEI